VALAKIVRKQSLLGTILRYDYEVRDEMGLSRSKPSPKTSKEMVNLASHIPHTKAGHCDPSEFKDEFEIELKTGQAQGRGQDD